MDPGRPEALLRLNPALDQNPAHQQTLEHLIPHTHRGAGWERLPGVDND